MKKTMSFIVLFVVLLLSVSAHTERVYEAAEGYKAPEFVIENGDSAISLAGLKGSYVLLSFWSSSDAVSRLAARQYDNVANKLSGDNKDERFCLLSVNFDRSESLFREIVRRDNLNAKTHYHVSSDQAAMIEGIYHLQNGYRSFLIDPEGRIVAVNPTATTIENALLR